MSTKSKYVGSWAHTLFVKYPQLFLPYLEVEKPKAKREVEGVISILRRHGIGKGARILDLSCGIGRHAVNLAKRGYAVVGYDPSPFFLDIAKKWVLKEGLNHSNHLKFYEGNPGNASQILLERNEKKFNVIINMWQSFGYAGVDEDINIFSDILKIATSNCILIIEARSRDWMVRNYQPYMIFEFDKLNVYETWKFSLESSVLENVSKFYKKDPYTNDLKLVLELPTTMQIYSLIELKNILHKAGWECIKSYDSVHSSKPVGLNSKNYVSLYGPSA